MFSKRTVVIVTTILFFVINVSSAPQANRENVVSSDIVKPVGGLQNNNILDPKIIEQDTSENETPESRVRNIIEKNINV